MNLPQHSSLQMSSVASAEINNTSYCVKDNQGGECSLDTKKSRRQFFEGIFGLGIFGRGEPLCRHYIDCSLCLSHCDTIRFPSWSPFATVNNLDRAEKNPNIAQTIGTVIIFDPHSGVSGPISLIAFACPNLHE